MMKRIEVGARAKFVGQDVVFHNGEREGKVGTIVADSNLDECGTNFDGGDCCWQIDGDPDWYVTGLHNLELV